MSERSGARLLVDQLRLHGVDMIFTVPGESFVSVLDAVYDTPQIRVIVCRHEEGAAFMAEAYGKLTGRPGVCLVARSPGASHAAVAVHTAFQDSTPMLLLAGQVARHHRGREAFQEVDLEAMFRPLAKEAIEVDRPGRLPELVARAFSVARSGRAGPVVMALPEDTLSGSADVADVDPAPEPRLPHPTAADIEAVRELLAAHRRPLVLAGGSRWSEEAGRDLVRWAEANQLPVAVTFRRQDHLDNHSPVFVGYTGLAVDPALGARIKEADLIVALGTRLGDVSTSGYTLLEAPRPRQTLIHIYPDPDELGRVYRPDLAIVCGGPEFVAGLAATPALEDTPWQEWAAEARGDYEAGLHPAPAPGDLDVGVVMAHLRERLGPEAILTNGAGNFTVWAHRLYQFRRYPTQLGPVLGTMGYGVPAAVAAKLVRPDSPVVAMSGDGDFLMTGQELATAMRYQLPLVVLVVNNGMYGTIRMHQERRYPGRVIGTDLVNPDFAAYARAFGAHGAVVERTADFPDAFEEALTAAGPALLELRVDPEALSLRASLSEIRRRAQGG